MKLIIQWPRFGPYHLARIEAVAEPGRLDNIDVAGLEIAGRGVTYGWQTGEEATSFERCTLFPQATEKEIGWTTMRRVIWHKLDRLQPDAVAICGYATKSAQFLLAWCRMKGRPAILMSESKFDDVPNRRAWKEWPKKAIIQQFAAALCGGTLHRAYLEHLGMDPERIFVGYDVVDNRYFHRESRRVRENPFVYRPLPGLESSQPFFLASARFIPRKNLDSLLLAYSRYRSQVAGLGYSPWRLVILGDGEERSNLTRLIQQQCIQDVTLPGFRQIDTLPAYYGLASAFIHPPLVEQWGLVVNEAMAAGLPVIVSERCGCAPDLVINGKTGLLFDPQDIQGLANLLVRISTGGIDLQAMGQAAKVHIGKWGLKRFSSGMLSAVRCAGIN